jgi:mitotic spindle assembly checkpoint protein MAD2B
VISTDDHASKIREVFSKMPPEPLPAPLTTYQALLTTFSDFLIVAIHTILYERGIYPASTFISTRKYNFPVRQNRHPKVCQWIIDAVSAVEAEMLKGSVDRVAVVIFSASSQPLERFMFDVSGFPIIPLGEHFTEFEAPEEIEDTGSGLPGQKKLKKIVSIVDIEEQLRATVRKLAYCGNKLGDLPEGCTFTVVVELKERAEPPVGHPQPWVPSEPSLQTGENEGSERVGKDLGGVTSVPIRTVEAGEFVVEMWIEEGKAKRTWVDEDTKK